MPVCEFEGNLSWGYNPSFYFAPDKYYGPKNDMKVFIDSCHNRGIAVIMDIVLNHCFGQSPLVQLYLDHYGTDEIYIKSPNPWFNTSSPNTLYKWGADFNHESISTQKLVDRINSYWLTDYNIDGFRFDFSKVLQIVRAKVQLMMHRGSHFLKGWPTGSGQLIPMLT